ncbi:alpha/beta fold hydrolase [Myceligenerans pegani]|uniref:Alpha/beta hydrolase n=1 Tax=Myceligenerans pegani TaxID=2776917 RepID=A0ABR9MWJ5_9MICO|nr:alpha/beta hydrolase [Myceligenerans sp. TRM 65318]MBE1875758.1 alpha/beta hydrolase [Myceligenerans sp. TRM 65318]MBE3018029.1 alpha/beta hydrolase [Myceligenerans sp. TRM 65318]
MAYVEVDGARVHHEVRGPDDPDAPTVVLVHGFTLDLRAMTVPFEPVFTRHPQWRRVYVDLPGHGGTKAPGVAGADDVLRVLRAAVELLVPGRYAVVGQSYGGYLARGLVAAHRDRVDGMAIVVPVIEPEHEKRDLPPRRILFRAPGLAGRVGRDALDADEIGVAQTPATWAHREAAVVPGQKILDETAALRIAASYEGTFAVDDGEFARPSLILAGRQDNVTGYRDAWTILEKYPRATFAVLDRAGHDVGAEQPELFGALVGDWLDRVTEHRERPEGYRG